MNDTWFTHAVRVRYSEVDQMGFVYHANYLPWLELGRTSLLRDIGLPYREIEERGILVPVTNVTIDYKKPARYDDEVVVYTRMKTFTHVRMTFAYEVRRQPQNELLAVAETSHVWMNREGRPVRIDRTAPDIHRLLSEKLFPSEP